MRIVTAHQGQLHTDTVGEWNSAPKKTFTTGLSALDELLPNQAFARGAVHELLALPTHPSPLFVALFLARCATKEMRPQRHGDTEEARREKYSFDFSVSSLCLRASVVAFSGSIVWCDPLHKLYPPAIASLGVPLDRLFLLHPKTIDEENWAIAECLRCKGVSATIASPRRLSRIEARRFQLAAEKGGGVGILIRPYDRTAHIYSATTRWLVAPFPGERTIQRWTIQLLHGHGGRTGQTVILEHHRETNEIHTQIYSLREIKKLVDRSVSKTVRATA